MSNKFQNKGSALISALFIMTLVAIAATAMSIHLQRDIYRTRISIQHDALILSAEGVTNWAIMQLSQTTLKPIKANETGRILDFPKTLKSIYPNILTTGFIIDLQSRFNLNNLQDKRYQPIFKHLLQQKIPSMKEATQKQWINALSSFIKRSSNTPLDEELRLLYLKRKPPYYPANEPLQDVSELRLVLGVTQPFYQALLPNICALPEITPININSAPKTLLMTLGKGLTASEANKIIHARGEHGVKNLLKIDPLLEELAIDREQITLESTYFLITATTVLENRSLTVYTMVKRFKNRQGRMRVDVIYQTIA